MPPRTARRRELPTSARLNDPPPLRPAVIYCRVSSREQAEEGYSIEAQQKFLRDYAANRGFEVLREFVDIESAKASGRIQFDAMLAFLSRRRTVRHAVLVEKTDRLYRNIKDWVTVDEQKVELHLAREGTIISEESRSSEKFVHGIKVLVARNYSDNLSEEVKKGMNTKAADGYWPSAAPFGYRNERVDGRSRIAPDPVAARVVHRLFDLYDGGAHSLERLTELLREEGITGRRGGSIAVSNVHKILRNPLYAGEFSWAGETYQGKDPTLVSRDLWQRVQARLDGFPDTRPGPRNHAFSGLLTCGWCGAAITAESHKGKYVYYRCAQVCRSRERYVREDVLSDLLGDIAIRPLKMGEALTAYLQSEMASSRVDIEREGRQRAEEARARIDRFRGLLDKAYEDKLEGRVEPALFERKRAEWTRGIDAAHDDLRRLSRAGERTLDGLTSVLELANSAPEKYFQQDNAGRRRLLDLVLLKCGIRAGALAVTWRKPFDLLAKMASAGREVAPGSDDPEAPHPLWSGREDLNLRLPAPETGALPGCATPRKLPLRAAGRYGRAAGLSSRAPRAMLSPCEVPGSFCSPSWSPAPPRISMETGPRPAPATATTPMRLFT